MCKLLPKGVHMKKLLLLTVTVLGAAAMLLPATAGAATVHGVVVARSHGKLLVATRSGRVVQVKGNARIGSRLVGRRVVGLATRARIHGVVVSTKGSTEFVASNHHLLAIHTGRKLAGTGAPSGPPPGTVVTTTITPQADGQLSEDDQTEDGQSSSCTLQVSGTVSAVGPGTITLDVNNQSVTLDLPDGLTLPSGIVGQLVTVDVSLSQCSSGQSGSQSQGDGDGDNSGSTSGDQGGSQGGDSAQGDSGSSTTSGGSGS